MTDEELDSILSQPESITATSGFAESVMAVLNSEASTPQPISFPWKRAVPGFAGAIVLLIVGMCLLWPQRMQEPSGAILFHQLPTTSLLPKDNSAIASLSWLFLALSLSLVSVKLSMYWVAARSNRRGLARSAWFSLLP